MGKRIGQVTKLKAAELQEGMVVYHSEQFWDVLAVEHRHEFTTCITNNGGRVSFKTSDFVSVSM